MASPTTAHQPWSVNTPGIVPFECSHWEGRPLFIIQGGIRGGLFSTVYGNAYSYENFPWPEGKKISEIECRAIAQKNNEDNPRLWVTREVRNQFRKILGLTDKDNSSSENIKDDTEYKTFFERIWCSIV